MQLALAAPVAEEVCVSVERRAAALEVPAIPASITEVRRALAGGDPIPSVSMEDLFATLGSADVPVVEDTNRFGFGTAALAHPLDPSRAWVIVGARAPDAGVVPLRLTFVVDTSPSMSGVFTRGIPPLQDEAPDGSYRPVSRVQLAKTVLSQLTQRLPDRAVVAVVASDRGRGRVLLPPTPIRHQARILQAIQYAEPVPVGPRSLGAIEEVTIEGGDPCADTRVLLLTDEHARIDDDLQLVQKRVVSWREKGATTWTLSLGTLGAPTDPAEAITELGGGIHMRADTVTDGVEQLSHALRASGVVARDLAVQVRPNPQRVRSMRRIDGGGEGGLGAATLPASAFVQAVYELQLQPGTSGSVGTLSWSVASPAPGEWQAGDTMPLVLLDAQDAPGWVRQRAVGALVGDGFAGRADWRETWQTADGLAESSSFARELVAWAFRLAHPDGAVQGTLPFLYAEPGTGR